MGDEGRRRALASPDTRDIMNLAVLREAITFLVESANHVAACLMADFETEQKLVGRGRACYVLSTGA